MLWPADCADPRAGQRWAIQVKLRRDEVPKLARLMLDLLGWHDRVVYYCAPDALSSVRRAHAGLDRAHRDRVEIREIPILLGPRYPLYERGDDLRGRELLLG